MIEICAKCRLASTRRKIARGRGNLPCEVLFIGEGPRQTEDLLGEAFSGEAGRLLDQIIKECRVKSFYIDNIVSCRPTDSRRGPERSALPDEVLACSRRLRDIIELASPYAIIWVGDAAERFYGKAYAGYRMLHPAALLRSGGRTSPQYPLVIRGLTSYLERAGIYATEKA